MRNKELGKELIAAVTASLKQTDKEFMEAMNPFVVNVELNEEYNTSRKLKIFDQFTQMSNCEPKDRIKHAKKIASLL